MDVARRAIPTETRSPTGRTNAYVLGRDPAVLVDPAGVTDDLTALVEARNVEYIVLTHAHPDHVGGVSHYRTTGSGERTCLAAAGHEDRFASATGVRPDDTIGDGDRLTLGDGSVRVLALPGHAPDHLGFAVAENGPVCCGDCAVREGSVVVGGEGADMRAYFDTLRRLEQLDPPTLLPGHGPPIENPGPVLERLRTHRQRRERQIVDAVERGTTAPADIVDRIYDKDVSDVRDLAIATVVAHLEKLDTEGELDWDGDRATPR